MENIYFYSTLNDELLDQAGYKSNPYYFAYAFDGGYKKLIPSGKNNIKLEDPMESWKVENDGIYLKKEILFEYPEVLYGKTGIACTGAEIGLSITWINRNLTQMGTILPKNVYTSGVTKIYEFEHEFMPGEIRGDLELDLIMYIKTPAQAVRSDEEDLMNEAGVSVGTLDETHIDFGNTYMDFPIQEVNDKKQPLWWLEMGPWTDPTTEAFDEDNICIYLNTAYKSCPKLGDEIKNEDVLIDIITTAYVMIFEKIEEFGYLNQTINDVDLTPGSISKIMFYFWSSRETEIDMSSAERRHKTIWKNVEMMINGGDE